METVGIEPTEDSHRPKESPMARCECTHCSYCFMPLAPRHEHDHFPLPSSAGGEDTIPCCINCHALKDSTPVGHWPTALVGKWMVGLDTPELRLVFASLISSMYRAQAQVNAYRDALVAAGVDVPTLDRTDKARPVLPK